MPQPSGISVTIKKDALNSALNMVSVMSEHAVFEPGDNEIKITSRPGAPLETGKGNSESILSGDDVKISGKMEPFGINISYLRAASDLCAEYIIIDMASGGAPALIRDPDAPDCTYVVMPYRI